MKKTQLSNLRQIFEMQLQAMQATLRPGTLRYYRVQANRFLRFLRAKHPEVRTPDQLRRNPHVLGWLRSMAEEKPPLTNRSRIAALICVRRLLHEIADSGYIVEEPLILPQDFPPRDLYLPKPISPEIDRLLDRELRKTDDLLSNALLLLRATGMRVGECLRLERDSIKHYGVKRRLEIIGNMITTSNIIARSQDSFLHSFVSHQAAIAAVERGPDDVAFSCLLQRGNRQRAMAVRGIQPRK